MVNDRQNLIVLHQLANDFEGFRRAIAIITRQQRDFAPVDAAAFVDGLEIGALDAIQNRITGSRAAKGRVLSDLDFSVGRAGIIFLLREGIVGGEQAQQPRHEISGRSAHHLRILPRSSGAFSHAHSLQSEYEPYYNPNGRSMINYQAPFAGQGRAGPGHDGG